MSEGAVSQIGAPESAAALNWRGGRAWTALLAVNLALGLVLGASSALGQMILEDWLALAPHLKSMQDLAVVGILSAFVLAAIQILEHPEIAFAQPRWWRQGRFAWARFPGGPAPSLVTIALVFAVASVAYLALRQLFGLEPLGLVLFSFAVWAVFAAVRLPLRLLRKLAREPRLDAQERRRPRAAPRRRN